MAIVENFNVRGTGARDFVEEDGLSISLTESVSGTQEVTTNVAFEDLGSRTIRQSTTTYTLQTGCNF